MKSKVVLSGFSTAKCIVNVAIHVICAASSKAKSPPWLVPITSQEVPAQVGTSQGRLPQTAMLQQMSPARQFDPAHVKQIAHPTA